MMIKDVTGSRFGILTVIGRHGSTSSGSATWKCVCDCGKVKIAAGSRLRNGQTNSCGCLTGKKHADSARTHGMSKSREFRIWCNMRDRCNQPKNPNYSYYGGRGVEVCDRWSEFTTFFADMGPAPSPAHTLDRIDVRGNYSPDNCRWASRFVQSINRRNTSIWGAGVERRAGKVRDYFIARIEINGKSRHLGSYQTAAEAHEAFKQAAVQFHGQEALEGLHGTP